MKLFDWLDTMKRTYFPWNSAESSRFRPGQIIDRILTRATFGEKILGRFSEEESGQAVMAYPEDVVAALARGGRSDDNRRLSLRERLIRWRTRVAYEIIKNQLYYHSVDYYRLSSEKIVLDAVSRVDEQGPTVEKRGQWLGILSMPALQLLFGPGWGWFVRRVHLWAVTADPVWYDQRVHSQLAWQRPEMADNSSLRAEMDNADSALAQAYQRMLHQARPETVHDFTEAARAWLEHSPSQATLAADLSYLSELFHAMRWTDPQRFAVRDEQAPDAEGVVDELFLPSTVLQSEHRRYALRWQGLLRAASFNLRKEWQGTDSQPTRRRGLFGGAA
jgi:hypothetical protein